MSEETKVDMCTEVHNLVQTKWQTVFLLRNQYKVGNLNSKQGEEPKTANHRDITPTMIVKCNYSERSNSLQQQIHNGHLYRLLSKEGKHFEPHPSGAETNKYGLKDVLTIAGWPHHQLLAHIMFLSEPTHIHPFILSCRKKINRYFPM
jgi:hypothetical protein